MRRLIIMFVALIALAATPTAVTATTAAPYADLERYAFELIINCDRTGGWIRSDGTCDDYGSGKHSKYRPPLRWAQGIADRVARPYAVKLAEADACRHDLDGANGGVRLRREGFDGDWGENIGCGGGTPREMILRSHLGYQDEKGTGGWHWRNIKRRDLKKVGVGVANVDGVPRLVEDFYQP